MKLERLPSVIAKNKFNEKGLVESEGELLVPVYVASQLGFNTHGKEYLNKFFYPALKADAGVLPLCPFTACDEYLDFTKLSDEMPVKSQKKFWSEFSEIIGEVNYKTLMPKSKFMISILDGGHAVDDGVSAEIGYYAANHGRIIGIRSDFRLAENPAAPINMAVRWFIDSGPYNGKFFEEPEAYDNAFKTIKEWADEIRKI
jgi:nucleoside 2-deoxyribosyltransferase